MRPFLVLLALNLMCVDMADARLFGRRKSNPRRVNTHNEFKNNQVPVAPPGVCTTDNCPPGVANVMPGPVVDVGVNVAPTETSRVISRRVLDPAEMQAMVEQTVVKTVEKKEPTLALAPTAPSKEAARVDRLITAMERRLGLEPDPVTQGDANQLFNKLPVVSLELKSQEGAVVDRVDINLKTFVISELTK